MCGDCWWFAVGDNKINGNARIVNKHMEPGMIIELTVINPHSKIIIKHLLVANVEKAKA
jgi:hypothetical protein